jgi:CarD family transcriptional regulator
VFAVGDFIIYGSEGVFSVVEYSSSPVDKNDDRTFYVLRSAFGNDNNVIYTPVDNKNVVMRAVMTHEQALEFIGRIPSIDTLEIEREKARRDVYRIAMMSGESDKYVSLIKTVYSRRQELQKSKKRLSDTDTYYEKKAKFCLYGELSIALGLSLSEVESFIYERLSDAG